MTAHVLVVEPVHAVAQAIVSVLERRDYRVTLVGDATEADGRPGRFDCGVFSDTLPDGNGISLAGWLLAEDRVASVVFFGHAADVDTRLRASNLGTFVPRGDGLHALSNAIAGALSDQQERARAIGDDSAGAERRQELKSGKRRRR